MIDIENIFELELSLSEQSYTQINNNHILINCLRELERIMNKYIFILSS
jgi:hypothetical protein